MENAQGQKHSTSAHASRIWPRNDVGSDASVAVIGDDVAASSGKSIHVGGEHLSVSLSVADDNGGLLSERLSSRSGKRRSGRSASMPQKPARKYIVNGGIVGTRL